MLCGQYAGKSLVEVYRGLWGTYPNIEVELVVCYRLDVESYGWYCGDDFADLLNALAYLSLLTLFRALIYLQSV
jgi:hypothetical protein